MHKVQSKRFTLFHNHIHQMLVFALLHCFLYFETMLLASLHLIVSPCLERLIFFGVKFCFGAQSRASAGQHCCLGFLNLYL